MFHVPKQTHRTEEPPTTYTRGTLPHASTQPQTHAAQKHDHKHRAHAVTHTRRKLREARIMQPLNNHAPPTPARVAPPASVSPPCDRRTQTCLLTSDRAYYARAPPPHPAALASVCVLSGEAVVRVRVGTWLPATRAQRRPCNRAGRSASSSRRSGAASHPGSSASASSTHAQGTCTPHAHECHTQTSVPHSQLTPSQHAHVPLSSHTTSTRGSTCQTTRLGQCSV